MMAIKRYRTTLFVLAEKFEVATYKKQPWGHLIHYRKDIDSYSILGRYSITFVDGDYITFFENGEPSGMINGDWFVGNYEEV